MSETLFIEETAASVIKGWGAGLSNEAMGHLLSMNPDEVKGTGEYFRHYSQQQDITRAGMVANAFHQGVLVPSDVPMPQEAFSLETAVQADLGYLPEQPESFAELIPKRGSENIGDITISPVELRVMHGIVAGWTHPEIGEQIDMPLNSVRGNARRLLRKVGLVSGTQLAAHVASGRLYGSSLTLPNPRVRTPGDSYQPELGLKVYVDRRPYAQIPNTAVSQVSLLLGYFRDSASKRKRV